MRRGWRMALCELSSDTADTLGIKRIASEPATALGSDEGIVATSPDADGHKYLLVCPNAHTLISMASTAGLRLTAAGTRITFALGAVVNSAAPDDGADTQDLVDQTFNYVESRLVPVGAY